MIGEGEAAAAAAVQRKLVKPETRFGGWRNRLVVAELATTPQRQLPALPRDLATLIGTGPIAIVDATTTAGAESRKALEALGLSDAVQSRSVGVIGTADASFLLARGTVRLAVVYATDVAANPEFSVAGTLADDAYPPILYWVAQTNNALSPEAEKFTSFMRQPQAQERLRADGLEVLP
jgi:molybdate transport system substrate-binding protein